MESEQVMTYLPLVLIIVYLGWRYLKSRQAKKQIPGLLSGGAVIVDVRSPEEFMAGSNPRSINIPVGSIEANLGKLDKSKPVVVCCASGARSGIAAGVLKRNGFKTVVNAGSWTNTM